MPAATMVGALAEARVLQVPTCRQAGDVDGGHSLTDDLWRLSGKGATLPVVPALSDAGGDAELFAALAQLDEARAAQAAAKRAFDVAEGAMEAAWRAIPGVLWCATETRRPDRRARRSPGITAIRGTPRHQYASADIPKQKRCSVEREAQIRLRVILAAVESWQETLAVEEERTGLTAAGERCDEATDVLIDAEKRVHDTPARTLAGLIAKAAVEVAVAERADLDKVALGFLREVAAFGAGRAAAQHGERGMIGVALRALTRFRIDEPSPAPPPIEPAPSSALAVAERRCDLSRCELRDALACYDVVGEAVRVEGHVLTDREASGPAFAERSLARAARRHVEAYERMADTGATP